MRNADQRTANLSAVGTFILGGVLSLIVWHISNGFGTISAILPTWVIAIAAGGLLGIGIAACKLKQPRYFWMALGLMALLLMQVSVTGVVAEAMPIAPKPDGSVDRVAAALNFQGIAEGFAWIIAITLIGSGITGIAQLRGASAVRSAETPAP